MKLQFHLTLWSDLANSRPAADKYRHYGALDDVTRELDRIMPSRDVRVVDGEIHCFAWSDPVHAHPSATVRVQFEAL